MITAPNDPGTLFLVQKHSNLSPADKKAVEDAEATAAAIEN
jgi:hypothetical protein